MRNARISRHALRRLTAFASGAALALGLIAAAPPAHAAIVANSASIDPSVFQPGASPEVRVSWTEGSAAATTAPGNGAFADPNGGNYLSVEVGWGWNFSKKNPTSSAVSYTAVWVPATSPATGGAFECRDGGTTFASFASAGFGISSGSALTCLVRRSSANADNPGQQVVLSNTGSAYFTLAAGSSITVTFPAGFVTAPASGPASDTWRIISLATSVNPSAGQTTTVRTNVPGPDGTIITVPTVTLNFDGNGGTCTPSSVTGDQGTWGTAPTADQCTNGSRRLAFFSTSPTAASGATNVVPGGPVYFLQDNRLYAIWAADPPSPPTDVVATPGPNSVKVTWKAPVSDGGDPIFDYCVQLRTQTNTLIFSLCSKPSEPLERTVNLPATNAKYTFTVVARNAAGSSEPVSSAPVSPYDIKDVTASRGDILFGLGGTRVESAGAAPGLAGLSLNVEFKVGAASNWTSVANAVKVNADSKFSWSRKFPASVNKQAVSMRFTYGSSLVSGTYVLARGGGAGDLSAPRNIKVDNVVNKVSVTWDRPKFDGGSKITGYTLCAVPGSGGGRTCRSESGTEGTFWNLNTMQTYTFTVSAKTATREGPKGAYAKPVDPTEASIRGVARSIDELTADVRGAGFKKNSRFRVEIAIPVPGENPRTWNWDEVTSFKEGQGSFRNSLQIPLDASVRGERLMLRLFTPTGTVYSRSIRP